MIKSRFERLSHVILSFIAITFLLATTGCQPDEELEVLPEIEEEKTDTELSVASTESMECSACDHVVSSYVTDGSALNIQPGDVICLDASQTYSRLVFRNIAGTNNDPVIIRNCGGVAQIVSESSFGLKFENSKHFKLMGTGSPDPYGIRVSTKKGFFITMEKFTTNFEISRIEVAGPSPNGLGDESGFAGIGVKTSPYQDCELFTDPTRQAWVMRDISIHHNYIHDTGGEGIYMGHGFYKGRKEANCPGITYSHSIRGVKIYENLIENVGYDGIQIKNANQHVAVYDNVIRNYGTKDHGAHNEGLFIGEGTTGKFYNNIVDTGTGNGCQIQGLGNLDIYNNLFLNSGENGIYSVHGAYVIRMTGAYFNIFNNTIYNSKATGFIFYNEDGGPKRFMNNMVVKAGEMFIDGAGVEMSNNIFTNDETSVSFHHCDGDDFKLEPGSEGIDSGADLSVYGILDDLEGQARPSGTGFDIGAYEYGG